jgi:hypothetical protein
VAMSYYLAIVSPLDSPLYEAQFATSKPSTSTSNPSSSTGFPSWSTLTSAGSAPASSSATTTASSSTVPGSSPLRPTPTRDLFPTALLGGQNAQSRSGSNSERHVLQMIAHSSLDVVEDLMVGNGSLWVWTMAGKGTTGYSLADPQRSNSYLRAVDKFNEWTVSAFVAPCGVLVWWTSVTTHL